MAPLGTQDIQVDWEKGLLTRKRSKTSDHAVVPVVCYQLWPETLELLRAHRSGQERVLLTRFGRPWIVERREGDKSWRNDAVRDVFRNSGIQVTPKQPRTLAATMVGKHPQYKFYSQYFLGHSPRNVVDKHYVQPNPIEFFEALAWLRQQVLGG